MTTLHGIFSAELPLGQLGFRPFHDGAVWATDPLRGVVMKLDAETLEVVAEIPVGDLPEFVEVGGGFVWVKTVLGPWTRYDATAF
mgnify:FL=1